MLIEDRLSARRGTGSPAGIGPAPERTRRSFAESVPASLKRLFVDVLALPDPDLPPELAFLVHEGVAPSRLAEVARKAAATGVTGEAVLLASGVSDLTYYRLLARHLGVAFLDRPLPLMLGARSCRAAVDAGFARLAPNPMLHHAVMAPRGEALRMLLANHRRGDVGRYDFTILPPRRFEALVRRGEGAAFTERAASGLAAWDAALSARTGANGAQRVACAAATLAVLVGLVLLPAAAFTTLLLGLALLFAAAVAQRLLVTARSAVSREPPGGRERCADQDLPIYTIIVPLFREARVLSQLLRNLDALDYPKAKLDVRIMLEAGDRDTQAAVAALDLPARYTVVVLPDGHPRTKPRALNAGLDGARGRLVVIYDAEDRPDPGQLREAVRRFSEGPGHLACLQARLVIDHPSETWLTRMFTLEYAALFHVVKPGLSALGLPIPLGGTSNHFAVAALRRVGGWDSWNVTEDIDLGYRLARFGFSVRPLDSDTYEEAPLTLRRWMPQRSRWLKGWMVTLAVHGRAPHRLFRELGCKGGLSVLVSLLGTVASCLLGPPLMAWLAIQAFAGAAFRSGSPLEGALVVGAAVLLMGGFLSAAWPTALGLKRLGRLDLAGWILALPLYLLLVSVASWRAWFEFWRDPQGWNKTEHGLARMRAEDAGSAPPCRKAAASEPTGVG